MDLPKRKPTRLPQYDYSQNGYYFVTICTHNKQKILCDIVGEGLCALPSIQLTPIGETVDKSIKYIDQNYQNVFVDKFVIMPNHVHLIIKIGTGGHGGLGYRLGRCLLLAEVSIGHPHPSPTDV